jgi:hypothetical protein
VPEKNRNGGRFAFSGRSQLTPVGADVFLPPAIRGRRGSFSLGIFSRIRAFKEKL